MLAGIDQVDRRIVQLLSQDPTISQGELSDRLKMSQPAVSARIRKLREAGVLTYSVGTNIKKTQLFLAKIDIVTTDTEHVIGLFEKCPMYFNSFLTSGKYNLTALLVGENIRSIMSCVDSHLRMDPLIKDMEFNLIVTPTRDFIVPIRPVLEKATTNSCGTDCASCNLYASNRCLGCPASIHYKGNLL